MRKSLCFILACVLLCALMPVNVNADIGPKPSVTVRFSGINGQQCYGTLLSSDQCVLMSEAWDGNEENARHAGVEGSYSTTPEEIWRAFVDYKDPDGFYYLQETWNCGKTNAIEWVNVPPSVFKVLLYFPESGVFVSSGIYETYAFDSYYSVRLETSGGSENAVMIVEEDYDYFGEAVSFVIRAILTLLVEIGVAFSFGLLSTKKAAYVIITTNIVTQILLNAAAQVVGYRGGEFSLIFFYFIGELLVLLFEAILYGLVLCRDGRYKRSEIIAYATVSNAISFIIGVLLSLVVPLFF